MSNALEEWREDRMIVGVWGMTVEACNVRSLEEGEAVSGEGENRSLGWG